MCSAQSERAGVRRGLCKRGLCKRSARFGAGACPLSLSYGGRQEGAGEEAPRIIFLFEEVSET